MPAFELSGTTAGAELVEDVGLEVSHQYEYDPRDFGTSVPPLTAPKYSCRCNYAISIVRLDKIVDNVQKKVVVWAARRPADFP